MRHDEDTLHDQGDALFWWLQSLNSAMHLTPTDVGWRQRYYYPTVFSSKGYAQDVAPVKPSQCLLYKGCRQKAHLPKSLQSSSPLDNHQSLVLLFMSIRCHDGQQMLVQMLPLFRYAVQSQIFSRSRVFYHLDAIFSIFHGTGATAHHPQILQRPSCRFSLSCSTAGKFHSPF